MIIRISFLLSSWLLAQAAIAQINYTDNFLHLLENARIDFYEPVEGNYKSFKLRKDVFQPGDFAMRSRREQIEIRYQIAPYSEHNPIFQALHVECMRQIIHLAANDEESVITVLSIDDEELSRDFNADWGKIFFFQPKDQFSTSKHCKMLALYAEGKGIVLVYFLFDKPSQELDNRYLALRFKDTASN